MLTVNGPMTRSGRVATLEEAKAQFQESWDAWKVGEAGGERRVAHRQGHQIFCRLTGVEPYRWPTMPRSGGAFSLRAHQSASKTPNPVALLRQLRRSRPKAASARLFVRNTRSGQLSASLNTGAVLAFPRGTPTSFHLADDRFYTVHHVV